MRKTLKPQNIVRFWLIKLSKSQVASKEMKLYDHTVEFHISGSSPFRVAFSNGHALLKKGGIKNPMPANVTLFETDSSNLQQLLLGELSFTKAWLSGKVFLEGILRHRTWVARLIKIGKTEI